MRGIDLAVATCMTILLGAFATGCASVDRGKSARESIGASLNQASGRNAAPRHQLREWRLESEMGGFVQLVLSSSGTYLLRHGYHYLDKSAPAPKTLLLSEASLGRYAVQGSQLALAAPMKSTCPMRIESQTIVTLDGAGEDLLMDEFASRNFVPDEFKGRLVLPWLKKFMGSLDEASVMPTDVEGAEGNFAAKMGCVEMRDGGSVAFVAPEEQKSPIEQPASPAESGGVAH